MIETSEEQKVIKMLGEHQVLLIHDYILQEIPGLSGLCRDKSLAATLHRIDDHVFYDGINNLFEIAALYAIAIAQGHPFLDGNKRTALVSMVSFLSLNGITVTAQNDEIEDIMVNVAEKKITQAELTSWLKQRYLVTELFKKGLKEMQEK